MKIIRQGETLNISEIDQLATGNADLFHATVAAALPECPTRLEIDLSKTHFVDCAGVGALIALRNCARRRNAKVSVRLLNPAVATRRLLRLTRIESEFPIVP